MLYGALSDFMDMLRRLISCRIIIIIFIINDRKNTNKRTYMTHSFIGV